MMTGSFKVVLMMVAVVMFAAPRCTKSEKDGNKAEHRLICRITEIATALLNSNKENEAVKNSLEEAIYGSNSRVRFLKDGSLTVGRNCHEKKFRGHFCTYYNGDRRGFGGAGKDGCFSESLLGAFFCICTPGNLTDSVGDLCEVRISSYSDGWLSNVDTLEQKLSLFKNVWDTVIHKCTYENINNKEKVIGVMQLEDAVKEIKKKIEGKGRTDGNLFFFGGSGQADCNGNSEDRICVGYQKKDTRGSAEIPWVEKMEILLKELQEPKPSVRKRSTEASTYTRNGEIDGDQVSVATRPQIVEPETNSETNTHDISENYEKREPKTEISVNVRHSEVVPKSRERGTTSKHSFVTEIPHLATQPNENGSLPTRPFPWFLLSTLLN